MASCVFFWLLFSTCAHLPRQIEEDRNDMQRERSLQWRLAVTALVVLAGIIAYFLVSPSFYTKTHAAEAASSSATGWKTYAFDVERSGYNAGETLINATSASSLQLKWSISTSSIISVQPIVANNLIYWGSWDGNFHAAHSDGTMAWTTNLGQTPTPSACSGRTHGVMGAATFAKVKISGISTPVVFVGGGKDIFYALNANTGAILWHNQISSPPTEIWASSLFYKGSVYISTASWGDCPLTQAQIFRINAATGVTQNIFNVVPNGCTGAGVWGSVTIDTSNGTLYFATGNGGSCSQNETNAVAVVELNATTLAFTSAWQIPASQRGPDSDFGNTPTVFTATIGGTVHRMVGVANKNGVYYALDEANISKGPVWQDTLAIAGQGPEGGQGSISPSAWDGTRLYVAGGNTTINGQFCQGAVRAVNPGNGSFTWQTCLNDGPVLGPVSEVPGVIAVSEGPVLAILSASSGQIIKSLHDTMSSNNQYYGGPSIFNGFIYIGNEDGKFYAYSTPSSPTPTPSTSPTMTTPSPTPSPGTVIAQDTFRRGNQTFWGTASDGLSWGGDANTQSAFSIASNTGQVANGNGIYNAVLGPTIGNSEVLFSSSISSFASSNFGAALHWTDTNDLYKGYIDGSNLIIQKHVNGVSTNIASTSFAATAGTSYTIRFNIVGTTLSIKAWKTGTTEPTNWMLTVTDGSLTSGFCGIRTQIQSGSALTVTSFQATAQ